MSQDDNGYAKVKLGDPHGDQGLTLPWPDVPRDLVEFLDRHYPARCAKVGETIPEIHHYAGMRALVETLRAVHRHQSERR